MNGAPAFLDLEAIARASRNCFLYEEAPDYLVILEQGIAQLGNPSEIGNLDEQFQQLVRVVHSVKGGAGLAEMPALCELSHKLEDLLIAIQEKRVSLHEQVSNQGNNLTSDRIDGAISAYQLLLLGLDRVCALLMQALNNPELPVATTAEKADPVCDAIDAFLQDRGCGDSQMLEDPAQLLSSPRVNAFVKTALKVDLEECLQRIESILSADRDGENSEMVPEAIATFAAECTLLGETLDLIWLSEIGSQVEQWSQESEIPFDRVKQAIAQIRLSRDQTLNGSQAKSPETEISKFPLESSYPQIESDPLPEWETWEALADLDPPELPKLSSDLPGRFLKYLIARPRDERSPENINLRVSLSRIDQMTKKVGELLIDYERLEQFQQQLEGAILNPEYSANYSSKRLNLTGAHNLRSSILLKKFWQVTTPLDQNRIDIVLGARNLRSTLVEMRESLEQLHGDLTQARMVPFREMTQRFFVLIDNLKQQYKKSVNLVVSGQDVLIDRWILEQLQTPLTHLLRNAFDHGIELPGERSAKAKSERATIRLSASSQGSHVLIEIADDGRGIDPQKVYQKALSKGLISENHQPLSDDEILQFLFTPGFSTAAQVTDISGRGVGLDIVVEQVRNLRGSVALNTALGTGTTFTISIPLTLSLLPLMIFRCQERTLAIPGEKILEVISLAESEKTENEVQWQNQWFPLFYIGKLLPYNSYICQPDNSAEKSELGLVVQVKDNPVVLAVDCLLGERRLVLKPLDTRVRVPAYVAGCTVLGNGEVVLVLSPDRFGELIEQLPTINYGDSRTVKDLHHHSLPPKKSPELSQVNLEPTAQETSSIANARPLRILIVDDSRVVRFSLQKLLSDAGFIVVEASDGEAGFATLARSHGKFDLVISDLVMPKLDGLGLLRKIRQSQWKDVPVVMLTARGNEESVKTAKDLGFQSYFTKPFHPAELLKSIATIVSENP